MCSFIKTHPSCGSPRGRVPAPGWPTGRVWPGRSSQLSVMADKSPGPGIRGPVIYTRCTYCLLRRWYNLLVQNSKGREEKAQHQGGSLLRVHTQVTSQRGSSYSFLNAPACLFLKHKWHTLLSPFFFFPSPCVWEAGALEGSFISLTWSSTCGSPVVNTPVCVSWTTRARACVLAVWQWPQQGPWECRGPFGEVDADGSSRTQIHVESTLGWVYSPNAGCSGRTSLSAFLPTGTLVAPARKGLWYLFTSACGSF